MDSSSPVSSALASSEPKLSSLPDEITYHIVWQYEMTTGESWDEEDEDKYIVFKRVPHPPSSTQVDDLNAVKEAIPVVKQNPSVKLVMPASNNSEKQKVGREKAAEGPRAIKQAKEAQASEGDSTNDSLAVKEGVQGQGEASTTEKPPIYRVTLNWRSYEAEHSTSFPPVY